MNAEHLEFIVPPECGGQIVEVSYSSDDRGVYRRTHDKSDGETSVQFAPWSSLPDDLACEPWNHAPAVPRDAWQRVSA